MLTKELQEKIVAFVKKEPCLVQDLSRHIGKSWVATEGYVERIAKETGLIRTKAFRKGTKGAVKVVFWNYAESAQADEIKARFFGKIKHSSDKKDFDPLEIFQFAEDKKSCATVQFQSKPSTSKRESFFSFLGQANDEILCFSGNLSWINLSAGKKKMIDLLEELLKRGVMLRILCRIDIASIHNIRIMEKLVKKYPKQIEIRHCMQPLRCNILDSRIARLKDTKDKASFKDFELPDDLRIFYDIYDIEWIEWLKQVFWYLFRHSMDYKERMKVLEKISF